MASERRVAVDTTVLVNYFTNGATDPPEWHQHSGWVLRAAERGAFRLVVPALALAELAGDGTVRGSHVPPDVRRDRVQRVTHFIRTTSWFVVVDLDDRVAQLAAELAPRFQLKGADAAIVASAIRARASVLYSWDGDHLKLDGEIEGMTIAQPEALREEQGQFELAGPQAGGVVVDPEDDLDLLDDPV